MKFTDWRGQAVAVRFPETVAFRWQDVWALPPTVRDDACYEVLDSPWLSEPRLLQVLPTEPHHFLLCFNAAGVLGVISGPLAVVAA